MSITAKIHGFKTAIESGLQKVDVLGISNAATDFRESQETKDFSGCVRSSADFTQNSITGVSYGVTGAQKSVGYAQLLPLGVNPDVAQFLQGSFMTQTLGVFSLLTGALGMISNCISIYEQEETLGCLYDLPNSHTEEKEKEQLIKSLEKLKGLNYHQFLNSLPEHLKKRLKEEDKSGEFIFDKMLSNIPIQKPGQPENDELDKSATTYISLKEIKTGALKKEIFHLVSLVGCVLAIAASIALILGCPLIGLMILSVIGIALTLTGVLMKKGWVENPKEGFNWKLCFPEFLHKKLHVDKEIETAMPNANSFMSSKKEQQNLDRSTTLLFPNLQTSEIDYNHPKVQEQIAIFTSTQVTSDLPTLEPVVVDKKSIELPQRYPSTYQRPLEYTSDTSLQSTVNPKEVSEFQPPESPKKQSFWKKLIPGFLKKEKID